MLEYISSQSSKKLVYLVQRALQRKKKEDAEEGRTFRISSALRCRRTRSSTLTTGILTGVLFPDKQVLLPVLGDFAQVDVAYSKLLAGQREGYK